MNTEIIDKSSKNHIKEAFGFLLEKASFSCPIVTVRFGNWPSELKEVEKCSELKQLLINNKIHFEYAASWDFARFCMGGMICSDVEAFRKIYLLTKECFADVEGIYVVVSHGNIEFIYKSPYIDGDVLDEVKKTDAWLSYTDIGFDFKIARDLFDSSIFGSISFVKSPIKLNDTIIEKGVKLTTEKNKDVVLETIKEIKLQNPDLNVELLKGKVGGLWRVIVFVI